MMRSGHIESRQMLHRRLVSLSRHGGATGIECRIFEECERVSECGRVGGRCFAARPVSFARLASPCRCGRLWADAAEF
jgi:hypothetical protein